jgi:hypothetical protein
MTAKEERVSTVSCGTEVTNRVQMSSPVLCFMNCTWMDSSNQIKFSWWMTYFSNFSRRQNVLLIYNNSLNEVTNELPAPSGRSWILSSFICGVDKTISMFGTVAAASADDSDLDLVCVIAITSKHEALYCSTCLVFMHFYSRDIKWERNGEITSSRRYCA